MPPNKPRKQWPNHLSFSSGSSFRSIAKRKRKKYIYLLVFDLLLFFSRLADRSNSGPVNLNAVSIWKATVVTERVEFHDIYSYRSSVGTRREKEREATLSRTTPSGCHERSRASLPRHHYRSRIANNAAINKFRSKVGIKRNELAKG